MRIDGPKNGGIEEEARLALIETKALQGPVSFESKPMRIEAEARPALIVELVHVGAKALHLGGSD